MRKIVAGLFAAALVAPVAAQEIVEPRSGVKFAVRNARLSLLGVGLRIKAKAMLKFKVYAVGLYVADSALAGPLAAHKGKPASAALYRDLVSGDFEKEIRMKFVRDLSADQLQDAFREVLTAADGSKANLFVSYFTDVKEGQEAVLHWAPGGTLETTVAGLGKPPIADRRFAAAVFGIWLGEKPIQEDIKKDLVSRAGELID